MAIDIYRTQTMLTAMELFPKRNTFLRDRYFPTTSKDIFVTEEVLVEYKDEKGRKIAPCVIPRKGGIAVAREGYKTERYTPPYIAPKRPLTIDYLNKKQFGETLFSMRKPSEREAAILAQDLIDLSEMIDGREEYMAARTIFDNGYAMRHYADKYGGDEYEEFEITFYDEEKNPAVYTPAAPWDTKSGAFLDDIYEMATILKRRGLKGADLLMERNTISTLLNNEHLLKLLDTRRLDLAQIKPQELPNGSTSLGKINIYGIHIEFICYPEEYEDEEGVAKQFIEVGKVALTAPNMGRTAYSSITQIEEYDKQFHTYAAKRVPHVTVNVEGGIRNITQKARPLTMPNYKNSAIVAQVLY